MIYCDKIISLLYAIGKFIFYFVFYQLLDQLLLYLIFLCPAQISYNYMYKKWNYLTIYIELT